MHKKVGPGRMTSLRISREHFTTPIHLPVCNKKWHWITPINRPSTVIQETVN